jgi:hypothetical protein
MKQYKEINFGVEYHVIEYTTKDINNGIALTEIFDANENFKYLKTIDKTGKIPIINYYLDGMRHNDFGPAKIIDNKEHYYILDQKIGDKKEFTSWRRTKMIDSMLNEG